ncbi:tRNA1(Val) (adenine(37)-N6)-methyltransferase [Ancylobacter lacus]|uniref:tRNA1(Val) (adenine(37)-N6)-methyltransferase n=1 Tax=Ancylobacter lacus TaxID=2579970 RepID=UPI001BD0AA50|nr:methyltransferase [Ancylobacter lacus]MBS7540523.1 methyltransferase [Ancylobacter lacus]
MTWSADTPEAGGDVTDDAVLGGRLRLFQPARGHRVGHDAILLAACVGSSAREVVDLGAGVGSAGLAVAVRLPLARVTLVEIHPASAALAARNAGRPENRLGGRVAVVEADIARLGLVSGPPLPAARGADTVILNPPFNDPTRHRVSPREARARAHSAGDEALETWLRAAERLLAPAGEVHLIHRPEALAAVLAALEGRFGAVRLRTVHPRPDAPAVRLLASAVKGRRTPLALLPPLVLTGADGQARPEAERLLREGEGF